MVAVKCVLSRHVGRWRGRGTLAQGAAQVQTLCAILDNEALSAGDRVRAVRQAVMEGGVPACGGHLRARIWPLLLGVEEEGAAAAFAAAQAAPPRAAAAAQIAKDVPRTLATVPELAAVCSEGEFTALLLAYDSWAAAEVAAASPLAAVEAVRGGYQQGYNRPAAVLRSVLPAPLAWAALCALLGRVMPGWYAVGVAEGVDGACAAVDEVLAATDPPLRSALAAEAENYALITAYSRLDGLYGSHAPYATVYCLWDAMLCLGPSLAPLLVASEAILQREAVLAPGGSGIKCLTPATLACDAGAMVSTATALLPALPEALRGELRRLQLGAVQ